MALYTRRYITPNLARAAMPGCWWLIGTRRGQLLDSQPGVVRLQNLAVPGAAAVADDAHADTVSTGTSGFVSTPGRRCCIRMITPYKYGTIVCMKKTLHIDEQLLRDAKSAAGAKSDTDTVRLGLEALVRRGAYERLRALRGSEPHARNVRRRRAPAKSVKPSAA